jgi:hypothetical protein
LHLEVEPAYLEEDTQRGEDDGENDLADIAGREVSSRKRRR